jgi:nanoRNase/pAp phosphatase (c-di-AMP/oligoRNAs hydrolase)
VEWVVVSGKLDGNLVIAVRNHGTGRRNAGELVRKLFGEMGSAGGHRNMSKAVIALNDWRAREHTLRDSAIETRLWELFEAQISGDNDDDD